MTYGNPFDSTLIYTHIAATSKTGANTTKTNLATVSIPAYSLQQGASLLWTCGGTVTYNTADRNLTTSVELGSFATYDTTHSRSGVNQGAVHGASQKAVITGGGAGNFTCPGILTTDSILEVLRLNAGSTVTDLTSEFTITANDTINNTGGTSSTGAQLIVLWGRQFLPNGTIATAGAFWGSGTVTVQGLPSTTSSASVGAGLIRFTGGVDQGGGPLAPSNGFDTDLNSGTINPQIANNFGFYVQWGSGSQTADVIVLNLFTVQFLGYRSPL